ncbi:hypothetical protein D3C87_1195910 [compost metagenome]
MGLDLGHGDTSANQGRRRSRPQQLEVFTQARPVERGRLHGAVAGLATFAVRVVVGVARHRAKIRARLACQVLNHFRAIVEIGVDALLIKIFANHLAQIADRFVV